MMTLPLQTVMLVLLTIIDSTIPSNNTHNTTKMPDSIGDRKENTYQAAVCGTMWESEP